MFISYILGLVLVLTGEQKTLLVVLQPRSLRAMALYQALPPMFERRSGAAAAALHGQIYAGVLSGDQSIGMTIGIIGLCQWTKWIGIFQIKILLRSWTTSFNVQIRTNWIHWLGNLDPWGQILWASGPTCPKHRGLVKHGLKNPWGLWWIRWRPSLTLCSLLVNFLQGYR